MKRVLVLLSLAGTWVVFAQVSPAGAQSKSSSPAASSVRGKQIFAQKCSVCHNANSTDPKVGPGLKGLYKSGTFTTNGNKITDQSLRSWIEDGDAEMPAFNSVLSPKQISDVIAYLKTL